MGGTLIGVPCMDTVKTDFAVSMLALERNDDTLIAMPQNSLVYDARNQLMHYAIKHDCEYILWLDSDMTFDSDILTRFEADMRDRDYVSGLFFRRAYPTIPPIYKRIELSMKPGEPPASRFEVYADYPQDAIFEVAGSGFGAVMMSVKAGKAVIDKFGPLPFSPIPSMGEDISFCWKLRQCGIPMYCDSRIKLGHIGSVIFDESVYINQRKKVGS